MTAWATVVGERLGFRREEALSIGMLTTCGRWLYPPAYKQHSVCLHRNERLNEGCIAGYLRVWSRRGYRSKKRRITAIRGFHRKTVSTTA